jgi:hypothetical protein
MPGWAGAIVCDRMLIDNTTAERPNGLRAWQVGGLRVGVEAEKRKARKMLKNAAESSSSTHAGSHTRLPFSKCIILTERRDNLSCRVETDPHFPYARSFWNMVKSKSPGDWP